MKKMGLTIMLCGFVLLVASIVNAADTKNLGIISGAIEVTNVLVVIPNAEINATFTDGGAYINSNLGGMGPIKFHATAKSVQQGNWSIVSDDGTILASGLCDAIPPAQVLLLEFGQGNVTFICKSNNAADQIIKIDGFALTASGKRGQPIDIIDLPLTFTAEKSPEITFANGNPLEIILGINQGNVINDYTATDRVGNDLTDSVVIIFNDLSEGKVGNYTVSYAVVDVVGLETTVDRTVNVLQGDTPPPAVTLRSPDIDATEVPVNQNIEITFSNDMDQMTIIPDTFFIYNSVDDEGNPIPIEGSFVETDESNKVIFNPNADLAHGTQYTVVIKSYIADDINGDTLGVKDIFDLTLIQDAIWTFETTYGDEETHSSGGSSGSGCFITTVQ